MKKKSPPYAFIGAFVLFAVFAFGLYKWKQAQDEKIAQTQIEADKRAQAAIDAANANKGPAVISSPANTRAVLFATQPVEAGIKLSPAFYEKKQTPQDILPDAYSDSDNITGWVAIRKIEKGDPLTPRNIGKSLPYLSQRLTPGMRAVALPVFNADQNNTGGFVVDGDKVDLLYTVSTIDNKFRLSTQMVMQNLSVLYVPGPAVKTETTDGLSPAPSPGLPISVTFEVTPEQAEALVFMSQMANGHFSMILRSRRDTDVVKVKPFVGTDYADNLNKIQKTTDASIVRVDALTKAIQAQEKAAQGNTNATTTPTPPSP